MQDRRSEIENPVQSPATPGSPQSEDERPKGANRPALVAGLVALLLAGSAVASPGADATVEAGDTMAAVHDQFASAFTPGPITLEPCCSVKMGDK
jgi:hypothetical protein